MRAYETMTDETRRRIRHAHRKIKFIGVLYLLGTIILTILAFLPAISIGESTLSLTVVNGKALAINNFFEPIVNIFSGSVDILAVIASVFYLFMLFALLVNLFKAIGKMRRLLKKTARYVRLNRNLDAMEDMAAYYSNSFGAIVIFHFLIFLFSATASIALLGYVALIVGLLFHFILGCLGGTISTFTSHASVEENKRKCGLFVYFVRNLLQVIAVVLILFFFMETSLVYAKLSLLLEGEISAVMGDIFALAAFALQLLLAIWIVVLIKHATAATEYNVWGSEGKGMLNFRVFSFFTFFTALIIAVVVLLGLSDELALLYVECDLNYVFIAVIALIMFILDCLLKSSPKEEEEVELPATPPMQAPMLPPMQPPFGGMPMQQPTPMFMPPVICVNTTAIPPMQAPAPMPEPDPIVSEPAPVETPVVPEKLPEELPPQEPSVSEWEVKCPTCGATLRVKNGEYHRCPRCSKVFQLRKTKRATIKHD